MKLKKATLDTVFGMLTLQGLPSCTAFKEYNRIAKLSPRVLYKDIDSKSKYVGKRPYPNGRVCSKKNKVTQMKKRDLKEDRKSGFKSNT